MYFLGLQAEQIIWLLFTPQNSAGLHQKKHTERGFAGRQLLKVTYSGMALGNSGHGTGIKLLIIKTTCISPYQPFIIFT